MTLCIRKTEVDDIPAMLAISNSEAEHSPANFSIGPETLDDWQNTFTSTQSRFPNLVAFDENTIIGFAKSFPWSGRCAYEHSAQISVYVYLFGKAKVLASRYTKNYFRCLLKQNFIRSLLVSQFQTRQVFVYMSRWV